MLDAIDIKTLTENSDEPIFDYKECLRQMMCRNVTPDCHLNKCDKCSSTETLSSNLLELLNKKNILEVEYSSWAGTDRSTLQTVRLNINTFMDELCDKLQTSKPNSFIAKEQSNFIKEKKNNLLPGEVIVIIKKS